ncbi:MAG: decarboxylating 6-phosphogluconate dehydrogenase [Nitrospirae bacterium]|nr:decarboxylating 6-phosphogluconate dehydrogenase [Candidatus Troglogloeales bacterium]MBI3597850.1 decarboxylating 6-phosphogluconate dehydrogenase [Candidatus Troglogloeales bacterium]
MELGFIGLGKMGMNMVKRLQKDKHRVVVYDRMTELMEEAVKAGCIGSFSLEEMVSKLTTPRAVWVMVPSGKATEETIQAVAALLEPDDVMIDGGNSKFHDDLRRAPELQRKGIHYLDVGTSGGIWGLKLGYCMMVGGETPIVKRMMPILKTLAPDNGWEHVGAHGAGHYVKMVHNGIEYAMMQGYAEGFELMSRSEYKLDLAKIADLWMHGSVVRSWLLELTAGALAEDPTLSHFKGYVQDSGEGRWMVLDAIDKDVPVPTLTAALFTRFRSRQQESFTEKTLSAMRHAFGGHGVKK